MTNKTLEGQKDYQRLMEIAFAFCQSQCLFTSVDLNLFSVLEGKAMYPQELSTALGIQERGSIEFFDSLVCIGLLDRSDGKYANTSISSLYLVKQSPLYIGGLLDFMAARLYPVWSRLPEAIRTGMPQNEARTETNYYANLGADKARHERFLNGMVGLSVRPAKAISLMFPWSRYRSFVDLGGALGSVAVQILTAHSHLTGEVFDLPTVRPFFLEFARDFEKRLTFHDGDFFADPLPRTDVFILGHILHNWSMSEKQQLLSKVYQALNSGGAVIIYEWLLDEWREKTLALFDSLNMLLVTRNGGCISDGACRTLLQRAGFGAIDILVADYPFTIVVGRKE
jgi:hypothetical protein